MSEGHVVARAMLTWMICAVTGAMVTSETELLLRAMSGSVVLPQLGLEMIFVAGVTQGL